MNLYLALRVLDGVRLDVSERQPTDAELLAEAADARALDITTGDTRFALRLHFDHCMRKISREPEVVDLSTPVLLKTAPNTVVALNRALDLGIRTYVD